MRGYCGDLPRQTGLSFCDAGGLKIAAGAGAAVCLVLDRGAGDKKGARAPYGHQEDCSSPISQRWSHGPEREGEERETQRFGRNGEERVCGWEVLGAGAVFLAGCIVLGELTERNGGGGGFEWRMRFFITSGAAVVAEF